MSTAACGILIEVFCHIANGGKRITDYMSLFEA